MPSRENTSGDQGFGEAVAPPRADAAIIANANADRFDALP
jgi:hypothetical protein